MSSIYGINGYGRLAVGYPVNINDVDVKAFTVDASALEDGIAPGTLLLFTDKFGTVVSPDPAGSAFTAQKVAGIALATNVKLDTVFPMGASVNWKRGEALGCAVRGEVAVKVTASITVKPGDAVYYDQANGVFTNSSTSTIALPQMRFTGNQEGAMAVVDIRY